ncbi:MAG: MEMO1 family protein [Candidatus Methanosuratincola petrocarbonis]
MRPPAAAGMFYPARAEALLAELSSAFRGLKREPMPVIGAVVPHAGYIYSGYVAAEVYARLPERETYVLIGPNHTGLGLPVAVSRETWRTPLGSVPVDLELADALEGTIVASDEMAHMEEHSIEVQLPFLQRCFSGFRILPICMGMQDQETAIEVGEAVADAILKLGRSCTVIASSDLTHYLRHETARKLDTSILESVIRMDIDDLYSKIEMLDSRYYGHGVCGYGPMAAMITASRRLGASMGKLLRYATSGDVTGDHGQVVGYGAVIFT